jgi:hypothetical protein
LCVGDSGDDAIVPVISVIVADNGLSAGDILATISSGITISMIYDGGGLVAINVGSANLGADALHMGDDNIILGIGTSTWVAGARAVAAEC